MKNKYMIQLDTNLWIDSQCMALKVDFLETKEEFCLYAEALYLAMQWGGLGKKEEEHKEEDMPIAEKCGKIRTWVRRDGREHWAVVYKVQGDAKRYVYDELVTRLADAYRLAEMIESPDFL